MTAFHEGRLPLTLAVGVRGGPERRTEIVTLGSGREERNTPWAHGRRRYDIGGALTTLDDVHALIAFFEARRGRWQAFRFRDPFDWKSCPPQQEITPLDQYLGEGDGETTAFQLMKLHGVGDDAYLRPIRKPVADSVRVAIDGAESDAFSVDEATGVVDFVTPPASGAALTAGFLFDTPVRFDTDRLEATREALEAGRISAPLIEVLV
ncbi:MAG: DUF2460 domain-containing protein [Hyphomonadaceae bacterium]|nr:DUF2460 domain-containing protein [Hyphomonadaceae bacterium]